MLTLLGHNEKPGGTAVKHLFIESKSRSIPKGILFGITLLLVIGCMFCSAFADEIRLTWNANSETDLTGYRIYKGLQSGTYTSNVSADRSTTSVTMAGLEAGKTYYFAATAVNSSNLESDYSNEVVYSVPVRVVTYEITASSSGNGTISPSGTSTVSAGASLTYSITPGTGCAVSDVIVDGVSLGSKTSYTFSAVAANHTIHTVFAQVTWTIAASSTGTGTLSPSGSIAVNNGTNISFRMTPASGYQVSDVVVDGVSLGSKTSYTFFAVTANHTIHAVFAPVTLTITASSSGSGTITPPGTSTVNTGASLTYAMTPETGYKVSNVFVDGLSVGSRTSYTFSSVTANHTIYAVFAPVTWTITASSTGSGTLSPTGSVTVNHGSSITFTMTPAIGYRVSDVVVDGVSQGEAESITFSNVTSNHGIMVSFVIDNSAPQADAGPDQSVDEDSAVTLSGENSTDPDGDALSFSWLQLEGPSVRLSNSETAAPVFQAPFVGFDGASLVFQLTVRDAEGLESTDTCIVNVTWVNDPPVADAGDNQMVYEGSAATLDASLSDDPDDGIVSYWWTQTAGLPVTLSDASSPRPYFIAPDVTMEGASLVFQLTVTDAGGLKSQDGCIVNVSWKNEAPAADAGADQAAGSGEAVTLNGGNSSDPDDGIASYRWTQVSGMPVTLSDPTAVAPAFTAPEVSTATALGFQLTVTDRGGLQSSDSCVVTVDPAGDTYDTVEYSLKKGWNMVQMIGTPVSADIASALASIKGKYTSVWLFEGGRWFIYYPNYSNNSLQTIESGKQYWIYMRTNAVLEIEIK